MKIKATSLGNQRKAGKKSSSTKSDFGMVLEEELGRLSAGGTAGVSSSSGAISPLLSVQEVPDADKERKRAIEKGHSVLDELEQLCLELLLGAVSLERLERLEGLIQRHRANLDDPRILEILNEIEVRASVELAKLGR